MSFVDKIKRTIDKNINGFQQGIVIYYRTSTVCTYCGGIDPVTNEPFRPNCTTCDGIGIIYSSSPKAVNVVVKKFVGDRNSFDESRNVYDFEAESLARVTCDLSDVLISFNSADSGSTYFDDCEKVKISGDYYSVQSTKKVGYKTVFLCEALLQRIKR